MNRIPKRVPLTRDITIVVRFAPPTVIAGIVAPDQGGAWDWQNKTIWIDSTLSLQRKWRAYRHELMHALLDIHEAEQGGGV